MLDFGGVYVKFKILCWELSLFEGQVDDDDDDCVNFDDYVNLKICVRNAG